MSDHSVSGDGHPKDKLQAELATLVAGVGEAVIGEATSIETAISTLANHGCKDLTKSVDLTTCGEWPVRGGGFCDVYQGRLYDGKTVALKCLRVNTQYTDADGQKEKILKRAVQELHQWSKLKHLNVLPLLGFARFRGHLSMVSEWMINGNLRSFLKEHPETDRIPFCMDIAAGLAHVHSDLKSDNVLVSAASIAMITDFGSSRVEYTTLNFTQTSTTSPGLTFRWMAPELFSGVGPRKVSEKTDVWAYGMTALEALTGKRPFEDLELNDAQFFNLVVAGEKNPPRPGTVLDEELWKIVESCWDREPMSRPDMKHINDRLQVLHPEHLSRWQTPCNNPPCGLVGNSKDSTGAQTQATSSHQIVTFNNRGAECIGIFQRLGELSMLDQAISNFCQAVVLSPGEDINYARLLGKLGNSYKLRFESHGEISDVKLAIGCFDRAIELTPSGDGDLANLINGLGTSYRHQFDRLKKPSDIDIAIKHQRAALDLLPEHHPDKPEFLRELGTSYRCRFSHHTLLSDIDKAIDCQEEGLKLTTEHQEGRLKCLNGLGISHAGRFNYLKDPKDLRKAMVYHNEVVDRALDNHPSKPAWQNDLGQSCLLRFQEYGERLDVETAIMHFEQAASSSIGPVLPRFLAARQWAAACTLSGDLPHQAYQRAMKLIPQLISLGLSIEQRCNLLADVGNFVAEAASWAISIGEHQLALGWVEEGRLIIWSQNTQLQTRFNDLSLEYPEIATRLCILGRELERASNWSSIGPSTGMLPRNSLWDFEQKVQRHHCLAAEWTQLLDKARDIPGFQNLLRPSTAAELMGVAKDGPVVVINLQLPEGRCDALIICPDCTEVSHVSLEDFPLDHIEQIRSSLRSLGKPGLDDGGPQTSDAGYIRGKMNPFRVMEYFIKSKPPSTPVKNETPLALESLWFKVVKPILGHLGYLHLSQTELASGEMPHVTWCLTGPLSFLPLHAAGCSSEPGAMELVVSSYALALSVLFSAPDFDPLNGILAVRPNYPTTEAHGFLGGAVRELSELKKYAHATTQLQLTGKDAKVEAVLQAMERYSWVHMACYATPGEGPGNRMDSAFHLSDGSLSLSRLIMSGRSQRSKGLAFLSGCNTAIGDEELPYEGLNLAVGMLASGYTSVIATMGEIYDDDAPEVAQRVYAELFTNGRVNHSSKARALHKAVMGLRERVGKDSFGRWVPFVHIGL